MATFDKMHLILHSNIKKLNNLKELCVKEHEGREIRSGPIGPQYKSKQVAMVKILKKGFAVIFYSDDEVEIYKIGAEELTLVKTVERPGKKRDGMGLWYNKIVNIGRSKIAFLWKEEYPKEG